MEDVTPKPEPIVWMAPERLRKIETLLENASTPLGQALIQQLREYLNL